jgi:hypothetical protein
MIQTHPDQLARIRDAEIERPMFQNVGQALWVAYALEHFRESPKTPLLVLLESVNDGNYSEPVKLSGMNLSGLTDMEQHAQGAFIRAAVCDLPETPRYYVQGNYSLLSTVRRYAMLHMAEHLSDRLQGRDRLYAGPITWHIMAQPKDRKQASVVWISRRFNVPIRSVERDIAQAKEVFNSHKYKAFSILEQKFSGTGLIP